MIVIPLQAIPAQTFGITLGGLPCRIALYQKGNNFFFDLTANGAPVHQCRMLRNRVWLVRYTYLGFVGDLVMVDTQGNNDSPTWDGLGSRYQLYYLAPAEVSAVPA